MAETDTKEENKAAVEAATETKDAEAAEAKPEAETTASTEAKDEENTEEKPKGDGDEKPKEDEPPAKKQKVEEKTEEGEVKAYEIDEAPAEPSTDDDKITSPAIVLFGLHPLVKEAPLSKLLETFGKLKSCSVRMAFASRYGTVEFETTDEAKSCYRALNNAKVMGKPVLVQPTAAKKE